MQKISEGRIILWGMAAILLYWNAGQLSKLDRPIRHAGSDFLGYWASAQLFFHNGNPYDATALYTIEKSHRLEDTKPIISWIPPWAHVLLCPFELLPFKAARIAWFVFSLTVLLLTAAMLWKWQGTKDALWIPWLAALLFVPGAMSLNMGSAAPLVLAGLMAFIWAIGRKYDALAGFACVLISIKPHVVYLFWLFLIVWIIRTHRWKVLFGLSGGLLSLLILSWFINPGVYSNYLASIFSDNGQGIWGTPTLSTLLRKQLPQYKTWLQFFPTAVAILFFPWMWRRWWNGWNWFSRMVPIVLVSMVTAPYLWPGDFVVLLPLVLLILYRFILNASYQWHCFAGLVLVQVVIAIQLYVSKDLFDLFWVAPALALIYYWSNRASQNKRTGSNVDAHDGFVADTETANPCIRKE